MALGIERAENSAATESSDSKELNLLNITAPREQLPQCRNNKPSDEQTVARLAENERKDCAPQGFEIVRQAPGVLVFHRQKDFVIAIDLAAGAGLRFHTGATASPGSVSAYGGRSPDFRRVSSAEALEQAIRSNPRTFCVFNGQFFDNNPKPTGQVAFPLKIDGKVASEGFARVDQHVKRRLSLELSPTGASIVPSDEKSIDTFKNGEAPNALVSLRTDVDRQSCENVGRTFVGLGGEPKDGKYTKVLVLLSSASTQAHAESVLRKFGAGPQIQLDGGGSTQFRTRERVYIDTPRTIPQFISVEAAPDKSKLLLDKKK